MFLDSHSEELSYNAPLHPPAILEHLWLLLHNPYIDWGTREVKKQGTACEERCFPTKMTEGGVFCVSMTSPESQENDKKFPELSGVPPLLL